MIIKKIMYNSKTKNYIFYINDISIEILENTLAKFNLYKGKDISSEDIENILYENELYKSKNLALKYLSNMKTENEVRTYLKSKDIPKDIIEETIEYLQKENFLNDSYYAELFTEDKLKLKQDGPNKIRNLLLQKGIDTNIINNIIINIDNNLLFENLYKVTEKKYNSLEGKNNKKEKLIRYLLNKGYDYSHIKSVLKDFDL